MFFCLHFPFLLWGEITRSYNIPMFNIVRNYQSVLQNICTILYSCQQYTRVPVFLHPQHHLFLSVCLIISILVDVIWYLIVILICISFIDNDYWTSFDVLIDSCIFFEQMSLQILCLFLYWVFVFLLLTCKRFFKNILHIISYLPCNL